jgi:hypothetical protein
MSQSERVPGVTTLRGLLLAVSASLLFGCGGKDDPVIPPAPGTVAIAPANPTLSAVVGATVNTTVSVTRGGSFTGVVTLTASGAPTGVTVDLTPASVPAGATSAAVAISVGGTAAPGSYTITITPAGSGGVTGTPTTIALTVTAAPFALDWCAADEPIWVAVQDGAATSPWTRVTGTTSTRYDINMPSGYGGVAFVDTIGTAAVMSIFYLTRDELANVSQGLRIGGCGAKTYTTSALNVSGASRLAFGSGNLPLATSPGTSTVSAVPLGGVTFLATRTAAGAFTSATNSMIVRRGVDLPAGPLPAFDFGAAEAFAPDSVAVTVTNPGGTMNASSYLVSTVDRSTLYISAREPIASGTGPAYTVPLARLGATELQEIGAGSINATSDRFRFASRYMRAGAATSVTLPPDVGVATFTRAFTTPYARPRLQLPYQSELGTHLFVRFSQSSPTRNVRVRQSRGYLGAATPTAWDVTVPDLSTVAGFNTAWVPGSGVINAFVQMEGAHVPLLASAPEGGSRAYAWVFLNGALP